MRDTISRARTEVGNSEPSILNGKVGDYKIKGTPVITARSQVRDVIELADYDLDVGLSYPASEGARKGSAVRRLKWYMS